MLGSIHGTSVLGWRIRRAKEVDASLLVASAAAALYTKMSRLIVLSLCVPTAPQASGSEHFAP